VHNLKSPYLQLFLKYVKSPPWAKFSTPPPPRCRRIMAPVKHNVPWAPGVFTQTASWSVQLILQSEAELSRMTDTMIIGNNCPSARAVQNCGAGISIACWSGSCVPATTWLTTAVSCQTLVVGQCGLTRMTFGSCSCQERITNSVIGVSRPPVPDYGTTFHLDYGGRDLPLTLLKSLWNPSVWRPKCLETHLSI